MPLALRYAEREARVWQHAWQGGVLSGTLLPILFLGAMGLGVGPLVEEHTGRVDGLDYLTFLVPGMLVAAAVESVTPNALWMVLSGHTWRGHFHAAVATPLRPTDVLAGYLLWRGCYAALNAVPFLAVATIMGGVPSAWAILAVPVVALTVMACAAPLAAYSCTQDSDVNFAAIMRIVVLPLVLLSGVFFPVSNLPVGLRPLAWLAPVWHGVELSRGFTTGSVGLAGTSLHLAYLLAFGGLGIAWGSRTITRRMHE